MKQIAYSIESVPFRPLNIAGRRAKADQPVIVAEMHFHDRCREWFFHAAEILLKDHEPTVWEAEFDHAATQPAEEDVPGAPNEPGKTKKDPFWERCDEWRALPKHEQDRMVLEALGDDKLTNREVENRLLEHDDRPHPSGVSQEIAAVTRRLLEAGELERQAGQFGMSRFRYFRRTKLSGPIKDLDESFGGAV